MKNPLSPLAFVRLWLVFFASALILSGATAIFARAGLRLVSPLFEAGSLLDSYWPSMAAWLALVHQAIEETYARYPFLAYGYDWLAFGHFIISIPFLMAVRDPRKHAWVLSYGMAACLALLPFALVFGAIRGIPLFWRIVDTLFGLGGLAVLLILRRQMKKLETAPA